MGQPVNNLLAQVGGVVRNVGDQTAGTGLPGGYVARARHPLDLRVIIVRQVAERCEPLREDRQYLVDQVTLLASQYDHEQLAMMHGFLSQCIRHPKRDTMRWMEQRARTRLAA